MTVLYNFCAPQSSCAGGNDPAAGLVQDTDGNFYGTTSAGGTLGGGTVFRLSMGLAPFVKTLLADGKVGDQVEILGTDLTLRLASTWFPVR